MNRKLVRCGRRPLLSPSCHRTGKNIHVAAGWNNVSRDGAVRCEVKRPLPVLSFACFVFLTHRDGKNI
jgi:hypothetical protein